MFAHRIPRLFTLTLVLFMAIVILAAAPGGFIYGTPHVKAQDPPPTSMPDENPNPEEVGDNESISLQPVSSAPLAITGGVWLPQGFSPANNGQVEGSTMTNHPVVGAIHALAAHPTNADILYIGSTNGGIWKTTNATSANPTWVPQLDLADSLSIGALEFDPTDATHNTLVAGIGRYSSLGRLGGPRTGLLRTVDGGMNWMPLPSLSGKNISGLAPRGSVIVASVNEADSFYCSNIGLFRSTDAGATFAQVGPRGVAFDLASDPLNNAILYSGLTSVDSCSGGALSNGIYKSTDTGATWTKVSNGAMDALIVNGTTNNVEVDAYGLNVFVNIVQHGKSVGIFYSGDGGANWAAMDIPRIPEGTVDTIQTVTPGTPIQITTSSAHGLSSGDEVQITNVTGTTGANGVHAITVINSTTFSLNGTSDTNAWTGGGDWQEVIGMNPQRHPGSQGGIHASIRIDPTSPTTVYIGGDRQDGPWPNYIGAYDYSANLWRGDATVAPTGVVPSPQWEHLGHSNSVSGIPGGGTASGSAPHADSREMVIDANGDLIESDDGGVSRRTSPKTNTGDWYSLNGNLQVAEIHDIAWDNLSNIIISGNQDTGTTYQLTPGHSNWTSLSTGDGGDVAVDNIILAGSDRSVRYTSYQRMSGFRRTVWDASGSMVSSSYPAMTVTGGGAAFQPQFVTPIATNNVAGGRLLLGGYNSLYESTDEAATIVEIDSGFTVNRNGHSIDYGVVGNPDVFYAVGNTNQVAVRLSAGGGVINYTVSAVGSATLRGVAIDPNNANRAFIIDSSHVYMTTDGGANWSDITGSISDNNLRSIVAGPGLLFVGGSRGVYTMDMASPGNWAQLGSGLPYATVWDLDYDDADKMLVAGMLGRGAWMLPITDAADPVIYAAPTVSDCATNAPCLSDTDPIENALTSVVSPGTVHVLGTHSVSGPLVSGNNGANHVTIEGEQGTMSSTLNFTGNGFNVGPGDVTVRGLNLAGASTVFNQTGGALSAYANNITGWTTAFSSSGGTASLGNNWWGTSAYNASDPGLPTGDWDKRLGADIEAWAVGSGSATLGGASVAGGSGTAVAISFGRSQTNAPFGNGSPPAVNDMCSDFYDFFVRNASGSWTVTVPVDDYASCNTNTRDQDKLGWIFDITHCATSDPMCWETAPNVGHAGHTLFSSNLTPVDLDGTHFVAGDGVGNDPTAVHMSAMAAGQDFPALLTVATALALLLLLGSGLLLRRRRLN